MRTGKKIMILNIIQSLFFFSTSHSWFKQVLFQQQKIVLRCIYDLYFPLPSYVLLWNFRWL